MKRVQKTLNILIYFLVFLIIGYATVGPDYKTPGTKVNENWRDPSIPQVKTEQTDHSEWWRVFNASILNSIFGIRE